MCSSPLQVLNGAALSYHGCSPVLEGAETDSGRALTQGGLTDLWLDDPYVVAASKLIAWAEEANAAGEVYPVWGTCLGHQLLQIVATNASFEELLVETDAVVRPLCSAAHHACRVIACLCA